MQWHGKSRKTEDGPNEKRFSFGLLYYACFVYDLTHVPSQSP